MLTRRVSFTLFTHVHIHRVHECSFRPARPTNGHDTNANPSQIHAWVKITAHTRPGVHPLCQTIWGIFDTIIHPLTGQMCPVFVRITPPLSLSLPPYCTDAPECRVTRNTHTHTQVSHSIRKRPCSNRLQLQALTAHHQASRQK